MQKNRPMKIIYNKLSKAFIVLLLLIVACWGCVEIVNRNSKNMTVRQKVLRAVYPLFTGYRQLFGKNTKVLTNEKNVQPLQSFYDLSVQLNNGNLLRFDSLRGKKVLLVNTASDCGFTGQYADLQELYVKQNEKLIVIGFPANDFKHQETGDDKEISEFCKVNFGVSFPLATKATVIKSNDQQKVFQWLTHKNENGWNDKQPSWNFSKYLVNEQGILTNYFDPSISPVGKEVMNAINK